MNISPRYDIVKCIAQIFIFSNFSYFPILLFVRFKDKHKIHFNKKMTTWQVSRILFQDILNVS